MTNAGKQWLLAYNLTSHAVVLTAVGVAVAALLIKAHRSTATEHTISAADPPPRPLGQRLLKAIRHHPLVAVLFCAYGAAMVHGTTWFYPEFPDLYSTIINNPTLDAFSLQERFIAETMQRNSFRFFPLAHQDLHILSWFTPYVSVWMLVSAAELVTTLLLSWRVVVGISRRDHGSLLLISLLFLFHAATGWGFFQLVYSERLLTLLFAAFVFFRWRVQEQGRTSDACYALSCALIGVFVKDIAVVLFATPSLVALLTRRLGLTPSQRSDRLDRWLCSLIPLVVIAYVALSLIPSLMVGSDGFDHNGRFQLEADWRLLVLVLISLGRLVQILRGRCRPDLLDGLNAAALGYAAALLVSVGYPYASFWTLPVQLVTVLNLGWLWNCWLAPRLQPIVPKQAIPALGAAASLSLIGLEHRSGDSFANRVTSIKTNQQQWLATYDAMDRLARDHKRRGEAVNVIFMRSYFNQHTLKRLNVDRLIEYDRTRSQFTVVEGRNRGQRYRPQTGDFLLIIDKRERSDLGQDGEKFREIIRHGTSKRGGRIFRHR